MTVQQSLMLVIQGKLPSDGHRGKVRCKRTNIIGQFSSYYLDSHDRVIAIITTAGGSVDVDADDLECL